MTWLRWDTDTARSAVVALLAGDLGVHPMQAAGHYFAAVCGFGDHQPDGKLDDVPDLALEQWAGWTGKRGRFAAAFKIRCRSTGERHDPEGTIRGWWRQRALLEKRDRDATRRKAALDPPKTRAEPARVPRETIGKPARYVNTSRTVSSGEERGPGETWEAEVRAQLPPDAHDALTGLLRAHHNPRALLAELRVLTERVRGATWEDVGTAIRDLVLAGNPPTGLALRAFVGTAVRTRTNSGNGGAGSASPFEQARRLGGPNAG